MIKKNNSQYFTRGGQITFHNLRMLFQINKKVIGVFFIFLLLIMTLLIWTLISHQKLLLVFYYYWACVLDFFNIQKEFILSIQGHQFYETTQSLITQPYFQERIAIVQRQLFMMLVISFFSSIFLTFLW